jgi:hypothetical protein
MERQDFDDSWKKAFDKAEIPPSENVWTNIELDLERANGSKLKKRLVAFQLLAAASVIFALGLGVGVFIMKNSYEDAAMQLAAHQVNNEKAKEVVPSDKTAITNDQEKTNQQSIATLNRADDKTSTITSKNSNSGVTNNANVGTSDISHPTLVVTNDLALNDRENKVHESGVFPANKEELAVSFTNEVLPSIVENKEIKLALPVPKKEEVDPVQLMLAKLDQRERAMNDAEEAKEEKNNRSEKLWTSVGFSAGSFSTVNAGVSDRQQQSPSTLAFAQNKAIVNTEAKASGISYSIGANIGTKLSERWVFQGGVNYLTQSSDYTANSAVVASDDFMSFLPASINELDRISASDMPVEEKLVTTAPYNVNNNLRYLSIPMQAGYMVINKNFGLQLNAGVATDVFLQNTVSADGGNLDKTRQAIGEDSPYRSVNLSGLAGTELSYRFSKNYRVALNPGIRYPFNSIYRSELAVKSTPITFDVGLRFRYIFR